MGSLTLFRRGPSLRFGFFCRTFASLFHHSSHASIIISHLNRSLPLRDIEPKTATEQQPQYTIINHTIPNSTENMFSKKDNSSGGSGHRRTVSTGSAPRLFVSPPAAIVRKISKGSRNEQRVRKAPCARIMEQPNHHHDGATATPEGGTSGAAGPGFFVNPPSFRIDNNHGGSAGNHHHQTLGVPMMGLCSDFYHATASPIPKPQGPRRVVSTGSAATAAPRVFVNPPAFHAQQGRVRKTLGVPMV